MKPYLIDIPVAIVFFNRHEPVKKVFESVKKARPSKLFLIQDGARKNNLKDVENIQKCRDVFNDIDWECEVYHNYSDENLGCGMRVFSGISWVFEHCDRTIILEDDCIPSQSFFRFCKDVLEKYKDDLRIKEISGMNHMGVYNDTPYSYFFSNYGSCWGWATWKRAWQQVDFSMRFMDNKDAIRLLKSCSSLRGEANKLINDGKRKYKAYSQGRSLSSWTFQHGISRYLNHQLIIVPKYNMISNIGIGSDSAHGADNISLYPKGIRRVFYMKTYEIEFPLKEPIYVIDDGDYAREVCKIMGYGIFRKTYRKLESIIRQILTGNMKWEKIRRKIAFK